MQAEPGYAGLRPSHRRRAIGASLACRCCVTAIPIGAIAVYRSRGAPFTDKQIALLQTFADQAVIAIENVRLFDELEARNRD